MRRPSGFALVDTAFMADTKFRKLRARLAPRDFNSAVGAYFIALAAARRNGVAEVDVAEEAEDATFLPDLIAVGLLCESGFPEKAFRDWAPRRPVYPSDLAPKTPKTPKTPVGASRSSHSDSSIPIPSTPSNDDRDEVRPLASNGLSLDRQALDALEERTGRPASVAGDKQLSEYDRLVEDHGLEKVVAAFDKIRAGKTMTARQLIWPAVRVLEPFPDVKGVPSEATVEAGMIRAKRVNEQVWARREEAYRFTGAWDEAWGAPPK